MAQSADTLFERLESALADWASDVESTHEHLAARVESARERAVAVPEGGVDVEHADAVECVERLRSVGRAFDRAIDRLARQACDQGLRGIEDSAGTTRWSTVLP